MTPAQHRSGPRWPVLAVVVIAITVVSVVVATRGSSPQGAGAGAVADPGALVSAPNAESSAWYCAGQSVGSGVAPGSLLLSNTTSHPITGSVTQVADGGRPVATTVRIPARGQLIPTLAAPSSGSWLSQYVSLAGGGVAVTQLLHGSSGWSVSPCVSTTSSVWYFPSGTTANSDGLTVALFNPTPTPDVVDLSFVTPTGTIHPINYQGIVLGPGQLQVENVANEVQNQSTVSTVVTTRTGRMVAAEVQTFSGKAAGLSVVPGLPQVEREWSIPQSQEASGGSSDIDVFNPGTTPENVTVHLRIASGPLAPLNKVVAPGATWVLATSGQTRIPGGALYSAQIVARGGPGVVVGRRVAAPSSAQAPQAGLANTIDGLGSSSPTDLWVVPPPGTTDSPVVSGAAPHQLALSNASDASARFSVYAVMPSGFRVIASGRLPAGSFATVNGSALGAAGQVPLIVRSTEEVSVSMDMAPTGNVGVVDMPGIPLAAAISL